MPIRSAPCHPDRPVQGHDLCNTCLKRAVRAGTIIPIRYRTPAELMAESRAGRVDNECWPWAGNIQPSTGYGRVRVNGKLLSAHRWAYTEHVGPIPEGDELDHNCHNGTECAGGPSCPHRPCVNYLWHLVPRLGRDNWELGESSSARALRTGCCGKCGRPYDTVSHTTRDGDVRRCSHCVNASQRRSYARKRATDQ